MGGLRRGPSASADVRELLSRPQILGLAEVMDMPALLAAEPEVLEKVQAAFPPVPSSTGTPPDWRTAT